MRKYIAIFLCICSLLALPVTAFASQSDTEYWKEQYGIPEPRREDYEDSDVYNAAWDAWYAGFSAFFARETQAEFARQAEGSSQETVNQPDTSTTTLIESVGSNDGEHISVMEDDPPAKYPIGSYVDPAGIVWSPDGTRLSPDSAQDMSLVAYPAEGLDIPSENAAVPAYLQAAEDTDTLAVIANLVSDIATDSPAWYVEDLRSADAPAEVLSGLKALVTSIFGEYTPVTTTSVVAETVGNDTHQYLVETVAPGAAGVDYEWLAGVFLFGLLLFCFMKLLGGVLK